VEAAVAEVYKIWIDGTAIPERIATTDGTVLMGCAALTEAMARYQEGMPIQAQVAVKKMGPPRP
ncbi:MAG TPA: hypothetical protein VGC80_15855, partial [Acetobacteraceae bacterium]